MWGRGPEVADPCPSPNPLVGVNWAEKSGALTPASAATLKGVGRGV
jgi:hypothetical protein